MICPIILSEVRVRRCTLCKHWQPFDCYRKSNGHKDGIRPHCRVCSSERERILRRGGARLPRPGTPRPVRLRLMERREIVGECWVWTGQKNYAGYGYLSNGPTKVSVHRASYELHVDPIPPGLEIDHLCRNRACFNPEHLEPVTRQENLRRAAAVRTHCRYGHPFDSYDRQGRRCCSVCPGRAVRPMKEAS